MNTFFIISSLERTGTHFLGTSIGSHPEATSARQLFNPYDTDGRLLSDDPKLVFREWIGNARNRRAFGFPIHHHHLWNPGVADAIIYHRPRVILLHRLQLLEQLCSREIATRTREWGISSEAKKPGPSLTMSLTPDYVSSQFENFTNDTNADRGLWLREHCAILDITYEYLCKEYVAAMNVVQDFLGLERRVVKPWTAKQESRSPSEIITNYAELADAMRRTEWACLFPE